MKRKYKSVLLNKSGNEMVEATIVIPILIIIVILLLRVFTFYLEILNKGIKAHEKALDESMAYSGKTFRKYEAHDKVRMFKWGLLQINLDKKIDTYAYFYNEDELVRVGELIE